MDKPTYPGLELCENMKLKRGEWRLHRIMWPLLYALVLAIMAGLLGGGPLSSTSAGSAGEGLVVDYERFLRHRAPDTLRVTANPTDKQVTLRLDNAYLRDIDIDHIMPTPARVAAEDGVVAYTFNSAPGKPLHVSFHFQPEKIGWIQGQIRLQEGGELVFDQFVYP
jgi:hypothetical protein